MTDLIELVAAQLRAFDGDDPVPDASAEAARDAYRNRAVLLLTAIRQYDDQARLPFFWVCDTCGQSLSENDLCNSGLHVGPSEEPHCMAVDTRELVAERNALRDDRAGLVRLADVVAWLRDPADLPFHMTANGDEFARRITAKFGGSQ